MKAIFSSASPAPVRSLSHTIGRNTIFGVIARVAQVSTRLVTIPIVIAHLGLGGYGDVYKRQVFAQV